MSRKHRRWYDGRPNMVRSIEILETFPPAIQSIVSEGIISIATNEFEANELMKSYKSLGTEKVLGLHKSKNKARHIDQNPQAHKALTYLYVLSEENQELIAKKIVVMMEYIVEYFRLCKQYETPPAEKEVAAITETYVAQGSEQAKLLLSKLKQVFDERLSVDSLRQEGVHEETSGMRIKD